MNIRALERANRRAREHPPRFLYRIVRALLLPPLRGWIRVSVEGAERVPAEGAAIIAPNHKNLIDPFLVGVVIHRPVRFMAKREMFRGPLRPLLLRLGAFPVRRGESDAEAMVTARTILEQGGLVVLFPEGTRVEDPDALGAPHHGAGRLAVETGAPLVPAAIAGTSHLWLGPIPKPRHVRMAFLEPLDPAAVRDRPDAIDELIDRELWPAVRQEYGRQLARPGLILAGLAALGLGGGLLARRQARSTPRVLGVVEPLRLRRRSRRRELLERLRIRR